MSSADSCPRCGHPFNGFCELEKFVGHVIETLQQGGNAVAIQGEVRRLDDLIHQLNQDRANLLRKVNSTQGVTRRLPPEILSIIFQFAHPPIDFDTRTIVVEPPEFRRLRREAYKKVDHFQLVLGAVSWNWRQVIRATPQLWTTLSVGVYEMACENVVSLLDLYFKNSGRLPMTVELDFRAQRKLFGESDPEAITNGQSTRMAPTEPLKTLFLNNAAKIQNLIVAGLPWEWVSSSGKTFSHCESLTLYWPAPDINFWEPRLVDLTPLSRLRHLRLRELSSPLGLPWLMLTTLQWKDAPINLCVEALLKCRNLVEFKAIGIRQARKDNSPPSLNQPVVLEYLESLVWEPHNHPDAWSSTFLCHFRFSKLRILKWVGSDGERGPPERHFPTFVSNLPVTLQVLELAGAWKEFETVKTLLIGVPYILELVLENYHYATNKAIIDMIGRPAAGLVVNNVYGRPVVVSKKLDGPRVLPRLRKLTISSGDEATPEPEAVARMLEALNGARVMREHFHLELKTMDEVWDSNLLARLKRLAESGFEFEIVLGSHYLDYMSSPSRNLE